MCTYLLQLFENLSQSYVCIFQLENSGETVAQASMWLRKSQRLSTQLVSSAPYPRLVLAVSELATGVAETIKLVQSQEVTRAL